VLRRTGHVDPGAQHRDRMAADLKRRPVSGQSKLPPFHQHRNTIMVPVEHPPTSSVPHRIGYGALLTMPLPFSRSIVRSKTSRRLGMERGCHSSRRRRGPVGKALSQQTPTAEDSGRTGAFSRPPQPSPDSRSMATTVCCCNSYQERLSTVEGAVTDSPLALICEKDDKSPI
jgi:hypothetical protein